MATKLAPTQKRLFTNVFVCKECSHKMRTDSVRILARKTKCRICGSKQFRTMRKK
jgi:ribosomal protein L40E